MVFLDCDTVDGPVNNVPDCYDDHNTDDFQHYRAELYRLETFNSWPRYHSVSKVALAKNGFYYLGSGDRVICAFCNVILRDWEDGDDVETEHRKHSPRCPFVLGGSAQSQNIPLKASETSEAPVYPQYKNLHDRLKTYEEYWPRGMKQRPTELAAAGFFYLEKGDAVRCFQCAGLLRNWEPNDNPWEEHKRFFPRCSFLQQNDPLPSRDPVHKEMMKQFVRQVSQNYDPNVIKKFEEYREANHYPSIQDKNQYQEELEQFIQQLSKQQNTEPPDPSAAAQCLASMTSTSTPSHNARGRDEIDGKPCVQCKFHSHEHNTLYPCCCQCCYNCIVHIAECPSCKKKVRAAFSSSKKQLDIKQHHADRANARRNLGFGNSVPGMDE